MRAWISLTIALALGACDSDLTTDAGALADADATVDAGDSDAGDSDSGVSDRPVVRVHLRATHDPVPHDPASAGQTPRSWLSGIRSLHLLRARDDASPFLVFSHGDGFVEASYADGADTVVGTAPVASLEPGVYTWARVVHTHVRFTLDAIAHSSLGSVPGTLEDLIVLSDRTTLDGVERERGDYRHVFRGGGAEIPIEGTGFEVLPIAGGGFSAVPEMGETAYYFPIALPVDDEVTEDVALIFEVNVHEGFRWTDQPSPGYAPGVFDIATTSTEPIVQSGANSYALTVE